MKFATDLLHITITAYLASYSYIHAYHSNIHFVQVIDLEKQSFGFYDPLGPCMGTSSCARSFHCCNVSIHMQLNS